MQEANVITSESLGLKLCEALGLDPARVSRIVIDIRSDEIAPARVYVEHIGDQRLLDFSWNTFISGDNVEMSTDSRESAQTP